MSEVNKAPDDGQRLLIKIVNNMVKQKRISLNGETVKEVVQLVLDKLPALLRGFRKDRMDNVLRILIEEYGYEKRESVFAYLNGLNGAVLRMYIDLLVERHEASIKEALLNFLLKGTNLSLPDDNLREVDELMAKMVVSWRENTKRSDNK